MIAIGIQAHSLSSRLPGKIYHRIGEKSVLEWCAEYCRDCAELVVVLGTLSDRRLQFYCIDAHIPFYAARRDDTDVLGRYADFVRDYRLASVVRITSDCPFPSVPGIFYAVARHSLGMDFTSNCVPPRHIVDGDDCEILSARFLHYLDQRVNVLEHREHVTSYVYGNIESLGKDFRIGSIRCPLNWSSVKTSVDTADELEATAAMAEMQAADPLPEEGTNG